MPLTDYTHVIIDEFSGEPLALASHIEEYKDGRRFALLRLLSGNSEPIYGWLRHSLLLPIEEASPEVRAQLAEFDGERVHP